jgi:hypothetical protein
MEPLKNTKTKLTKTRRPERADNGSGGIASNLTGDEFDSVRNLAADEKHRADSMRINLESNQARAKRLAARKARTLKAFQTTFENRSRKPS